jgi:nucleoside-diphosphate-sugar epimerase
MEKEHQFNMTEISNRRVLIIGAGGYIGPVVTKHLLVLGYSVRALDLFLYNTQSVLAEFLDNPAFELVVGDHCDKNVISDALANITDVVILAGLVGDPITKKYPHESQKINDDGLHRVVDLLNNRSLNRVIFISTCSNYGLIEGGELADETFQLNPLSLYAKAKVTMERTLIGLQGDVDYSPTVLRFATAFGLAPRMRFDLTVSQFTRDMHMGREMLVYDADTWRPYCHVKDFGDVIERVLAAPADTVAFEIFNAGGDVNNFTKQMIVDTILEELPNAKVSYQKHGSDPRNYRVDFSKIRNQLGFEPQYTLRDGIIELIEALESNAFADADNRPNFHGNYEIHFQPK